MGAKPPRALPTGRARKPSMMKYPPEQYLRMLRKTTRLLVSAVILLGTSLAILRAQGQLPQDSLRIDLNDPAMRRISDKLMCQCGGCNASVLRCPHELDCNSRAYIRNTIQRGLNAGDADDVIVAR